MIIVDTDVLIEIFDKQSSKGKQAIELLEHADEDIAITSLSLHELLYGHYKRKKNITEIQQIHIIEFNKKDATLSAKLEHDLEKKGNMIPRFDCMIAAITMNQKAKLFTFNTKHFQHFKKLELFKL